MTESTKPIRVLLIDDHAVMRAGLRLIIDGHAGMQVVGEAANRRDALVAVGALVPDIILLDIDLGEDNGLDLLPELLAGGREGRVVLLTGLRNPEMHYRAVRLGAMGLVLKEKAPEVVLKAIEKVYAGEVWLDRTLIASILEDMTRPSDLSAVPPEATRIVALTEREREVIAMLGEGLRNKLIAERLYISEATVRHHLTSIFSKLGVTDRFELAIYAYRHGLARLPE